MPSITDLLAEYDLLRTLSGYLYGADLLSLCDTSTLHRDFIRGNETRFATLRSLGLGCNGQGNRAWKIQQLRLLGVPESELKLAKSSSKPIQQLQIPLPALAHQLCPQIASEAARIWSLQLRQLPCQSTTRKERIITYPCADCGTPLCNVCTTKNVSHCLC